MIRLYIFAVAVILSGLGSCVTPKKAVDVLSRPKNEPVAAEFCSLKYPVRDSIIKGDSIVHFDTLWETFTDTLISEPQVIIETKLVPKTVLKTVTVRDTIIRENTATVSALNTQISALYDGNQTLLKLVDEYKQKVIKVTDERDDFKKARDKWKLRFFLLLFGVGLAYAAKVKLTKRFF